MDAGVEDCIPQDKRSRPMWRIQKKSSYVAHTKEVVLRGAYKRSRPMWRTQKKSSYVAHTKEVVLRGAHKRSRPMWRTQKEIVLCGVQETV